MPRVRNPRRLWFPRHSTRRLYEFSVGSALVGVGWITYGVLRGAGYPGVVSGVLWLLLAAVWLLSALQNRRRERYGYDQAWPVPTPEVRILAEQGRKILAIKRYREQNPDIGLKEAKGVIDAL